MTSLRILADGYTLMLTANSIAANPSLYQPAPFDPARDVTPISVVGRVPVVIVANPQSGPESIRTKYAWCSHWSSRP